MFLINLTSSCLKNGKINGGRGPFKSEEMQNVWFSFLECQALEYHRLNLDE